MLFSQMLENVVYLVTLSYLYLLKKKSPQMAPVSSDYVKYMVDSIPVFLQVTCSNLFVDMPWYFVIIDLEQ